MPPKFFITHSWKDIDFTRRLCDDLRAHGLDGFFDAYSILPGDDIAVRVARGLEECDVYVPLLSPAAVESPWCEREIGIAIDLSMERGRKGRPRIVPVIIEPCKLPTILRGILFITFDGRYAEAFNELLTKGFGLTIPPFPKPMVIIEDSAFVEEIEEMLRRPSSISNTHPRSITNPKTGKEMILVPASEFVMGTNDYDNEKPRHKVYLDAFYISRYPVTNAEYKKFVDETKHGSSSYWSGGKISQGNENHPVGAVSWHDVMDYCKWACLRLPTEAEWEKAASWDDAKKTKFVYPWGDKFDASKCNTRESNIGGTTPVGKYSPQGDSPYGLSDMAGNVWEWCSSLYKNYSYDMNDGREDALADGLRLRRGGSWLGDLVDARCANRLNSPPDYRYISIGFRVAESLPRI